MRDLVLRKNRKGLGVYAGRRFRKGEIVEDCPVLVFVLGTESGVLTSSGLPLRRYVWEWRPVGMGLALGRASFMNHRTPPNVGSRCLYGRRRILLFARRDIARGEELCIDYGPEAAKTFKVLP